MSAASSHAIQPTEGGGRHESCFVSAADGTVLHVRRAATAGGRTTCVLIHGYGDGSFVWYEAEESLADVCATASVDLRGHGDSEASRSGRYDLGTHSADVEQVIRTLQLERVILIGHSLGGQIAMTLAAALPACVVGVVLADACPDPNVAGTDRAAELLKQSLRAFGSVDEYRSWLSSLRPILSQATAQGLAARALRKSGDGLELKIDPALTNAPQGESREAIRERLNRCLAAISCPTLLIRGTGSAVVSAPSASRMLALLRNAELVTVPRAGHAVMSDNPDAFNAAVKRFVRAHLGTE